MYINSTNTTLNLKQGQLSQLLLKTCGDELQTECSEYAPLKPGQVAVTGAKNLKCSQLFHIALPDYKTANSERVSCSPLHTSIYAIGRGFNYMFLHAADSNLSSLCTGFSRNGSTDSSHSQEQQCVLHCYPITRCG